MPAHPDDYDAVERCELDPLGVVVGGDERLGCGSEAAFAKMWEKALTAAAAPQFVEAVDQDFTPAAADRLRSVGGSHQVEDVSVAYRGQFAYIEAALDDGEQFPCPASLHGLRQPMGLRDLPRQP